MDAESLKSKGNDALKDGRVALAESFYSEAIALAPDDKLLAILYSNRAACRLKVGDARSALADANKCTRFNPLFAKGFYRKGCALDSLARLKEAAAAFHEAFRLDNTNEVLRKKCWEVVQRLGSTEFAASLVATRAQSRHLPSNEHIEDTCASQDEYSQEEDAGRLPETGTEKKKK